jgi:TetR/AcrR family transcriptional regulator, transcriptional repressor for nem operon
MSSSTPTKGERTRAEIVRKTAELMNRQGFLAAPLSAVIEATGIQKGGLYRHFENREALAHEAFDHAVGQIRDRFLAAVEGKTNACDRLLALLASYDGDTLELPLPGGCPIMNSAIESDHADEALRTKAKEAMSAWQDMLRRIVSAGLRDGQIRPGVSAQDVATVVIASIEGAVMLTHLHGDAAPWRAVRRHLASYVEHELRPH